MYIVTNYCAFGKCYDYYGPYNKKSKAEEAIRKLKIIDTASEIRGQSYEIKKLSMIKE